MNILYSMTRCLLVSKNNNLSYCRSTAGVSLSFHKSRLNERLGSAPWHITDCMRSAVEVQCCLVECCFTSTETVGLLGTGAQDVHLNFHTAPELCSV